MEDIEDLKKMALVSSQIQTLMKNFFENMDIEKSLRLGMKIYSGLAADFIDSIIKDDRPQVKLNLCDDFVELIKKMLAIKKMIKESNKKDMH